MVLGGGGREHAIAWRLAQSPSIRRIYAAPGNPGIAGVAECIVPPNSTPDGLLQVADRIGADLTVVGPEAPLVAGVVDRFRQEGRLIVGPTEAAARLEGSKIFAKEAMVRFGVPTADYAVITSYQEAVAAIGRFSYPVVLKADGLAAGKGVLIVNDRQEALKTVEGLLSGRIVGSAGSRIVIEEFLTGEEVSFIGLSDGRSILPLEPTQDHKAVFDNDKGPNTGGMGAYCDSRILSAADTSQIIEHVMLPVVEGMRRDGCPFTGFLYAGLMMTGDGPKVLEFNVRLGDPETQALMTRMSSDFVPILMAAARGDLAGATAAWHPEPSVCVVMASAGYPGTPRGPEPIAGIAAAEATGAAVFHAGTTMLGSDLVTSGGRVLGVTASGPDLAAAVERSYAAVSKIHFDGMQYRRDIGRKGLKRWAATLQ
jgi:phosphoribosylamine--glycine ligase